MSVDRNGESSAALKEFWKWHRLYVMRCSCSCQVGKLEDEWIRFCFSPNSKTESWVEANGKIRSLRKNALGSEIFIQESLPVEWILDCEEHYNQDKLHHDVANWLMFTMFFMWVCWCLTSVAEQIKNALYLIVFLFHNACIRKKQHLEKCSVHAYTHTWHTCGDHVIWSSKQTPGIFLPLWADLLNHRKCFYDKTWVWCISKI